MSRKQILQPVAAEPEQVSSSLDLSDRATQFQVIPQVCLIADVCRLLRISTRQFHYLMDRHELALTEMKRFDRKRRFTGESVARIIRMRATPIQLSRKKVG